MAVELTYEPETPSAGDALYFTVTGSTDGENAAVVVTADGDEMQKSPPFGLEDAPEGTGADRFTLEVYGGTGGDFTLEVYRYGDDPSETDPIYYHADAQYTYPDADDVADALEAALPGLEATVTKEGPILTVLLGGQYSGRDMQMTIDAAGITGSETTALVDAAQQRGPYRWGPVVLPADVYEADVIIVGGDDDGESLLDDPLTITIS